jgi:hypothetical protein
MEYIEVIIHKKEETSANNIPNESMVNLIASIGVIEATTYSILAFPKISGAIEAMSKNIEIAAANVQLSRIFFVLLDTITGTTTNGINTTKSGFIEKIVSIF